MEVKRVLHPDDVLFVFRVEFFEFLEDRDLFHPRFVPVVSLHSATVPPLLSNQMKFFLKEDTLFHCFE